MESLNVVILSNDDTGGIFLKELAVQVYPHQKMRQYVEPAAHNDSHTKSGTLHQDGVNVFHAERRRLE